MFDDADPTTPIFNSSGVHDELIQPTATGQHRPAPPEPKLVCQKNDRNQFSGVSIPMVERPMDAILSPYDPISELLKQLTFTSWRSGFASFQPPWAISGPSGSISLYAMRSGECQVFFDNSDRPPLRLGPNHAVILGDQTPHRLAYDGPGPTRPEVPLSMLYANGPTQIESTTASQLVHAHFSIDDRTSTLLAVLPDVLFSDLESKGRSSGPEPLLTEIARECLLRDSGWRSLVDRMTQLLFIQILRGQLAELSDKTDLRSGDWVRAAMDPVIGPVLRQVHDHPDQNWTVANMGRETGMARSAFAERFRTIVGKPPLQYVTEFRMARACEMLRSSRRSIRDIALMVGYESPSSFTHAFRRAIGTSPAEFRQSNRQYDPRTAV